MKIGKVEETAETQRRRRGHREKLYKSLCALCEFLCIFAVSIKITHPANTPRD